MQGVQSDHRAADVDLLQQGEDGGDLSSLFGVGATGDGHGVGMIDQGHGLVLIVFGETVPTNLLIGQSPSLTASKHTPTSLPVAGSCVEPPGELDSPCTQAPGSSQPLRTYRRVFLQLRCQMTTRPTPFFGDPDLPQLKGGVSWIFLSKRQLWP